MFQVEAQFPRFQTNQQRRYWRHVVPYIALFFLAVVVLLGNATKVMYVTYYEKNANCSTPTGAKSSYTLDVCYQTMQKFIQRGSDEVDQYFYDDLMCSQPCSKSCPHGLYYPYHLNRCNSGICETVDGVVKCGNDFIPTVVSN